MKFNSVKNKLSKIFKNTEKNLIENRKNFNLFSKPFHFGNDFKRTKTLYDSGWIKAEIL